VAQFQYHQPVDGKSNLAMSIRRCGGFTLIELLVVLAIVAVISAIVIAAVARSRSAAQNVACLSNVHTIGLGFTAWASEHSQQFPDPVALNQSWEQCLSPYLSTGQLFACPADSEIYPAVGSSYDWRDTGDPSTTLAGKSMSSINRANAVLAFESLPGWHFSAKMNAACLDGSARTMDQQHCLADLQTPLRAQP
jgi:prepilin-type N-terminal cleavage/methylation domain-containing protein